MNRKYRKTIIAGNWKMHKTATETKRFAERLKGALPRSKRCSIVLCVPYVDIPAAVKLLKDSRVAVGAQNLHWEASGPFTGEISAAMLADLDVKYVDPTDIHRIPAELAADDYARVQELACRAHRALGCTGFSRSDFIVTDQGPVILETNTIPGMTETSLFPDELRHAGIAFSEACAQLIDIALDRAADGAER